MDNDYPICKSVCRRSKDRVSDRVPHHDLPDILRELFGRGRHLVQPEAETGEEPLSDQSRFRRHRGRDRQCRLLLQGKYNRCQGTRPLFVLPLFHDPRTHGILSVSFRHLNGAIREDSASIKARSDLSAIQDSSLGTGAVG